MQEHSSGVLWWGAARRDALGPGPGRGLDSGLWALFACVPCRSLRQARSPFFAAGYWIQSLLKARPFHHLHTVHDTTHLGRRASGPAEALRCTCDASLGLLDIDSKTG